MNIDNVVQMLVKNLCEEYGGNSKCDGNCFKRCKKCEYTFKMGNLARGLLSMGAVFQPFRVGSIVYYVDLADIHRPIKEKIVSEYCFNEKVSLIILRDPLSNLRTSYSLPCDCIFSDYEEARTYLVRNCKM